MKTKEEKKKNAPLSGNLPTSGSGKTPPAFQLKSDGEAPAQKQDAPATDAGKKKDDPKLLYPYSPQQLKAILESRIKANGWDEQTAQKYALSWLSAALRMNRKNGSHEFLKQFEQDVITHFPKTGPQAIRDVAEGKGEELNEFRQALVEQMDERLGPGKMIVEGSQAFTKYVIDPESLKNGREKNPGYTTCVDWQPKLIRYGVAENKKYQDEDGNQKFKLKGGASYPQFFGNLGIAKAKQMGVWNEASEAMPLTVRPKPGDVVLLQKNKGGPAQHTCVLKSIEVLPDGKEKWISTDGGQNGGGGKQAAKEITRIYDPKTNIIAGASAYVPGDPADLKGTWLSGWVDVDGIIEQPKASGEKKEVK